MKFKTYADFLKGANWWERGLFALLIWMIAGSVLDMIRSVETLQAYVGPRDTYLWLPLLLLVLLLLVRIVALRSLMGGKYPWLGGLYLFVWAQIFQIASLARHLWILQREGLSQAPVLQLFPVAFVLALLPAIVAGVVIYQRWRSSQVQATS